MIALFEAEERTYLRRFVGRRMHALRVSEALAYLGIRAAYAVARGLRAEAGEKVLVNDAAIETVGKRRVRVVVSEVRWITTAFRVLPEDALGADLFVFVREQTRVFMTATGISDPVKIEGALYRAELPRLFLGEHRARLVEPELLPGTWAQVSSAESVGAMP